MANSAESEYQLSEWILVEFLIKSARKPTTSTHTHTQMIYGRARAQGKSQRAILENVVLSG